MLGSHKHKFTRFLRALASHICIILAFETVHIPVLPAQGAQDAVCHFGTLPSCEALQPLSTFCLVASNIALHLAASTSRFLDVATFVQPVTLLA